MRKKAPGQQLKNIDSPNYTYWQALYKAFYSWWLYVDVGKRWKGYGFLYLLLAVAVFSMPVSLKAIFDLKRSFQ